MNFLQQNKELLFGILIAGALIAIVFFVPLPSLLLLIIVPLVALFVPAQTLSVIGIVLIVLLALSIFMTGNETALTGNLSRLLLGAVAGVLVHSLKPGTDREPAPRRTRPTPKPTAKPTPQAAAVQEKPHAPVRPTTPKRTMQPPAATPAMGHGFKLKRENLERPRTRPAPRPASKPAAAQPQRKRSSLSDLNDAHTPPVARKTRPRPAQKRSSHLDLTNSKPKATTRTPTIKRPPRKIQL